MIAKIAAAATITHFAHTAGHQNMAKTITAAANKNRQKQSFMIFPPSSSSQNHDKTKAKPIASNRSPFIKPPGFFPLPGIDLREAGQRGDVSCDEYRVSGRLGKRLIARSRALHPRQPLPGILDLGHAGIGVLPEVKETLVLGFGVSPPMAIFRSYLH